MESRSTTLVVTVLRSWEPGTLAIVTAELQCESDFVQSGISKLSPELQKAFQAAAAKRSFSTDLLLSIVKEAVTFWVKTTEEGKRAWEGSSEDFNIGDLANEDIPLEILISFGILLLDIRTSTVEHGNWEYDTILVNSEDLESDEDGE